MTNDLQQLNRNILKSFGNSKSAVLDVLDVLPVCVGKFILTASQIRSVINSKISHVNSLRIYSINQDYLQYARLIARDVCNGEYSGLITLSITMTQAECLAQLQNLEIQHISRHWLGLVFELQRVAVSKRKFSFQEFAIGHFAIAVIGST